VQHKRRLVARLATIAGALLVVGAVGIPAASAATGVIGGYDTGSDGTLSISFSSPDLPPGQSIDPTSVTLSIAGQVVPNVAAQPASDAAIKRVQFLTIDISASMQEGTKLQDAKDAANIYLDGIPDEVLVGLISFNATAKVVVPPTTDRARVREAVAGLTARSTTAIWDALVLGTQELVAAGGIGGQLVLSDGGDTDSKASLEDVVAAVTASGTSLNAVSIGGTEAAKSQLAQAAAAGNGEVLDATDSDEISAAFQTAAAATTTAVVVRAPIPAGYSGSQSVTVTARAGDGTITDSAVILLPETSGATPTPDITEAYGPKPVPTPDAGIFGTGWILPAALAALGLGLFILLAVALLATDRDSQTSGRVRRRLSRYSLTTRDKEPVPTSGALGQTAVARSAVELAGRVTQSRGFDNTLAVKLEAAGVPLKPPEWLLIHFGIAFAAALVFMLIPSFSIWRGLLGLALGAAGPQIYLGIKEDRRKSRFAEQLPDTLQLLAGSLAAGYSLPQAVDTVVKESDGAMAVELNRAIVEARLGVPMEDALETVARRMNSVDFAWVVMAIRIQREVGGNLAEVLNSVAATMRERERLRRQVQVLSAEGRLSAVILGLLPVLFILYLVFARPAYLSVLVTTPLGLIMSVVGVVLLIAGAFWLRKVVKVDV